MPHWLIILGVLATLAVVVIIVIALARSAWRRWQMDHRGEHSPRTRRPRATLIPPPAEPQNTIPQHQ